MSHAMAIALCAALAGTEKPPERPGPDSAAVVALQRRFHGHAVARVSRQGSRTVLTRPEIGTGGIGYQGVADSPLPEAAPLPAPIPWSEVDTLWMRRSLAKTGFTSGALMLGAVTAGAGYGFGKWAVAEGGASDAPLVGLLAGFAVGALVGGTTGGVLGSLGHEWVMAYPAAAPEPAPGPRSRRR
jgi:hypothetical protein